MNKSKKKDYKKKHCPNCGSQNRENALYCIKCGSKFLQSREEKLKKICEIVQKEYKNYSKFYNDPKIFFMLYHYFGFIIWYTVVLGLMVKTFQTLNIQKIVIIYILIIFSETTFGLFTYYHFGASENLLYMYTYVFSLQYDNIFFDSKNILYLKCILMIKQKNPYIDLNKNYKFFIDILTDRQILKMATNHRIRILPSLFEEDFKYEEYTSEGFKGVELTSEGLKCETLKWRDEFSWLLKILKLKK